MSSPEETIFGICPVCGGSGADDPDATGADVPATDTTGSGLILVDYEGKMMCETCRTIQIAKKEDKEAGKKHAEEERFRSRAGFVRTIS